MAMLSAPLPRSVNQDGQFRRIRSDAQIGNVRSIQHKAADLIEGLGAKTRVGELRASFGGLDVSEIVALPKAERAAAVQKHLAALGLGNKAAEAAMTAALFGSLGDKILAGDSYYVEIGGKKLDRQLLESFILSLPGGVSAADAKGKIVPEMIDGKGMTAAETETYLFAMRHLPVTDKALREVLIPALRDATGAPVMHLGPGQQGFDFTQLYDHLEKNGRLQDLYSAKADMSSADMLNMWENKITLEDLNKHLEHALAPKSLGDLKQQFGAEEVKGVQDWLKAEGDTAALKKLAGGKMSPGELQNLIYGSWQMANTPYDPHYEAKYAPMPITAAGPSPAAKALNGSGPVIGGVNPPAGANAALNAFLSGLEKQIGAHDWKGLLKAFNAENRKTQLELGVTSDAQYIAEGLGLHMVDNALPGDVTSFASLEQIKSVKLGREAGAGEISGVATLADGSERAINIFVTAKGKGFEITPAVG